VPSSGGVFEVDVDGVRVFSKAEEDRFPAYQEVPRLVIERG
jgi:selT/selW/selH-like putative selenoprotein